MGSEFGAWLDHFTDEMFGYVFASSVFYLIHLEKCVWSPHFISIVVVFAILGVGGKATFEANESEMQRKDFEFKHMKWLTSVPSQIEPPSPPIPGPLC